MRQAVAGRQVGFWLNVYPERWSQVQQAEGAEICHSYRSETSNRKDVPNFVPDSFRRRRRRRSRLRFYRCWGQARWSPHWRWKHQGRSYSGNSLTMIGLKLDFITLKWALRVNESANLEGYAVVFCICSKMFNKSCQIIDSNPCSLVSEVTALPTVP